jgi:hypothetical protein
MAPGTYSIGDWVDPRADIDAVEKRKILLLLGIKPRPFSPQPVAISTELSQLLSMANKAYFKDLI